MIWGDALVASSDVQGGGADHIRIRGTRLDLAELVDRRLFDPAYVASLRAPLLGAQPFPHLVLDGWFNPELLTLVREEFDLFPSAALEANHTKREKTYRSRSTSFGPATSLYYSIVNAGWFVDLLAEATGVPGLVPDANLHGGGLHESRHGGSFDIHRDFDHHPRTGLYNEMVLLTYLNRDWNPAWNGALELWDPTASRCVKRIQP
ncbi:MAG TPA: 2OG-Fe(II) oxygenase, partial [Rhizobacter sp.]|nr:2OG-Fe(II) oxygenase [Rhizobacter sp.]